MNPASHRVNAWIAASLRWSSGAAVLAMLAGLVWMLASPDLALQIGPAMPLRELPRQLADGNPYALMQLGLLLLLASPLARLLAAAVVLAREGDWRHAAEAVTALLLIAGSVLLATLR